MPSLNSSPQIWRSLEELEQTPEFREYLEREFPQGASVWEELGQSVDRRRFLQIMAASFALAGMGACSPQMPRETIVPQIQGLLPDEGTKSRFYATAFLLGGIAEGILARSFQGRPIKIEGNPDHPSSGGGTHPWIQAEILTLYDPLRSKAPMHEGTSSNWDLFLADVLSRQTHWTQTRGKGLRLLTESVTSPSLGKLIQRWRKRYPEARWHVFESCGRDNETQGLARLYGKPLHRRYHLKDAKVIVSLDADFLLTDPARLRLARELMDGKRVRGDQAPRNRLYVAESTPSITGAVADHRLPIRSSQIGNVLRAIAGGRADEFGPWLSMLLEDLKKSPGASVIIAGENQPPAVHALAHALNQSLGNIGKTVTFHEPLEEPGHEPVGPLLEAMGKGEVEDLLILGGNPVYTMPVDTQFADKLTKIRWSAHLAPYFDETSRLSRWHLPESHALESWGDARAEDGTVTLLQPLIAPLFDSRTAVETLAACSGLPGVSSRDLLADAWPGLSKALHDGFVAGSARPTLRPSPRIPLGQAVADLPSVTPSKAELEVVFRPSPSMWDGRFAPNAWLQELPDSLSMLTWGNAAWLSHATARKLALENEDAVTIQLGDRKIEAPVWIMPGHADDALTLHLGYGRGEGAGIGKDIGFNANALRTSQSMSIAPGATLVKLGRKFELASAQMHHDMNGRELIQFGRKADAGHHQSHPQPSVIPAVKYTAEAWAMVIDLSACIGCRACTIACQAENNIPTVGKDQVRRGRELHWIRVDRYFSGPASNPAVYFQPVPCMHCETAPCELVCPTAATNHSFDGLNQMIYNRCVGTRYCANNCPYKVRRFNFLEYNDLSQPITRLQKNPEVTIRSRGVMEKCTYCVQRINQVRTRARVEKRPIGPDEVRTACQAACPTQAIFFGDKNNPKSEVSRLRSEPLHYELLGELGTHPRTTYLGFPKRRGEQGGKA